MTTTLNWRTQLVRDPDNSDTDGHLAVDYEALNVIGRVEEADACPGWKMYHLLRLNYDQPVQCRSITYVYGLYR